jgi:uncharacterized membrane protein YedE/YeeE
MKIRALVVAVLAALGPRIVFADQMGTDPLAYSGPAWSPYLVGALIGGLTMLTFYFSGKPLGASTAYARLAGMAGRLVAPRHTDALPYFQKKRPEVEWGVMLLLGVVAGAFLAAWQGGELTGEWLPPMWAARFGEGAFGLRVVAALAGGIFMAFGARLAGGCTSGHGISGTLQLSVGSWIAVFCFFAGGVATAMLLFRV